MFASPALRDDRHRILARLANGGSIPSPARHWIPWAPPQRARLAAVATLLATGAAAWVWLQNAGHAPSPEPPRDSPMHAELPAMPASISAAREDVQSEAATIITATPPPTPAALSTGAAPSQVAAKPADSKPAHSRPVKVAGAPRRQQAADAVPESDEDVTLLTAMLKHAKPQQPPSTVTSPKD
ncbi:hypothetical protein [Duganella sp. CF458]|uniref:hypothetical protein n=1 Tax=Duganella sp. CF458 TaxID=1884368 RepID=UPI001113E6E3|nr:hypothetical protein [Duganella sp. CF458]